MSHLKNFLYGALVVLCVPSTVLAEVMTLAWDRNSEPEVTGYRLSYSTTSGSYTTTVDAGNQTSITLTGLTPGQRYYFIVKAYTATGLESAASNEATGVALGLVSLTSTAPGSLIPTGTPVTWTALASAGPTLEYQFWRQDGATSTWSMVRDYAASNAFSWTPLAGEEGTYVVRVYARVPGSSEPYDAQRSTSPFTVGDSPIKIGAVEASVAFPAATGAPITFKARASGGTGPLQYRFYRFNRTTSVWSLMRDYSTSDSFTWTPVSGEEGSYNLQVWVRSAGSTQVYDAFRSSDPFVVENPPPNIAIVKANRMFPVGTGTPITFTAVANGGPGPLNYRFYRYSQEANTWTMVQDYGPSDSYTWTPTAGQAGTYVIQAWVRRPGSTAVYDAWASSATFQVADSTPAIRSIIADTASPLPAGGPVTWTIDATGGPGALQYQFSLYSVSRDTWTLLQDYSTSNTFTWMPGAWDAGTYQVRAAVRRGGSTGAADATSVSAPFEVVTEVAPTVVAITRTSGSTLRPGMPVVWTATVAGGKAPVEFTFARYSYATGRWTTVQTYSWDNSYAWTPMPGDEGTYLLYVWVRRAGSTAAYEHYMFTPSFIIN